MPWRITSGLVLLLALTAAQQNGGRRRLDEVQFRPNGQPTSTRTRIPSFLLALLSFFGCLAFFFWCCQTLGVFFDLKFCLIRFDFFQISGFSYTLLSFVVDPSTASSLPFQFHLDV